MIQTNLLTQNDFKKGTLPQNVYIYGGDMDKKRFFQYDLMKRCFRLYLDIFAYMAKKRFFKSDLKHTERIDTERFFW